jgi:hypothetical protein
MRAGAACAAVFALLFYSDAARLPRSCGSVLANNLVSKGLTARPKTVTRATDALLLLVEMDAAEAILARACIRCAPPLADAPRTRMRQLRTRLKRALRVTPARKRCSKACRARCQKASPHACLCSCKPSSASAALRALQPCLWRAGSRTYRVPRGTCLLPAQRVDHLASGALTPVTCAAPASQSVRRARDEAVARATRMRPAAGPQGQGGARWRERARSRAHALAGRGGRQARPHRQDARRAEEGGACCCTKRQAWHVA